MNKLLTQIRDITKIEALLESANAGVLALNTNEEHILQVSCTYLYYHKNVYAVIPEMEDLQEKIVYESGVSFTVLHSEKPKVSKSDEFKPLYKFFSVTLNCILKRPEEVKITDEIKELYLMKYFGSSTISEDEKPLAFLMLDTVEIKSFEEAGG